MKGLLRVNGGFATNIGPRRATNQDRAKILAEEGIFLLADGMGGHEDGHRAAELAVETVADLLREFPQKAERLRDAFAKAHELIAAEATQGGKKMGTTLTSLLVENGLMLAAHVGDSRLYRLRQGRLERLTKDHSYVQMLMDQGQIDAQEATRHPMRHVLVKAIGGQASAEPDVLQDQANPGDRYVLCSDGLSSVVNEETIQMILENESDNDAAANLLVDKALENGTTDNVTVVVVAVGGE